MYHNYKLHRIQVVLFGGLLLSFVPAFSIVNYENDPDLAKAMEYDLEMNHADLKKYNRQEAEKYYLKYLENAKDDFQIARVYCQLGAMYAVAFNAKSGEKSDFEKARKYYKKVIETEPERIGRPTIVARNMLASMLPCDLNRVKARTEVYKWLDSITEEDICKKSLPRRPVPADANSFDQDQFRNFFENKIKLNRSIDDLKEGAVYNACCDSKSLDVPEEGFLYILSKLPENAPEKKIVKEFLSEEQEAVINSGLRYVLDSFIDDDVKANNGNEKVPGEIKISRRFIPEIEFAVKEDLPFILDFQTGEFLVLERKFTEAQQVYDMFNQAELVKGDLAWNNSFFAVRDCLLFTPKKENKRALKSIKKEGHLEYEIPKETRLPYSLLIQTKEKRKYLVTVYKMTQDGVWIYYRQLSDDEFSRY